MESYGVDKTAINWEFYIINCILSRPHLQHYPMLPYVDRRHLLAFVSCHFFIQISFLCVTISYLFAFYYSWLCCYMTQMNPLIGPKLSMNEILIVAKEWGNPIEDTIDITYY